MRSTIIKGERFEVHPRTEAPYLPIEGYKLDDVYKTYSGRKAAAFTHCKRLCKSVGGTGLAITSHNTFTFTARFYFYDEEGRPMIAHITPSHNHAYYVYD